MVGVAGTYTCTCGGYTGWPALSSCSICGGAKVAREPPRKLKDAELAELRDWLLRAAPTCSNETYAAGVVSVSDIRRLFRYIEITEAKVAALEKAAEHAVQFCHLIQTHATLETLSTHVAVSFEEADASQILHAAEALQRALASALSSDEARQND